MHSRLSTGKLTSSLKKFLLFIIIIIIMIKTMIIEVLSQSVRTDCQEKQEFTPYTNVQHQPHGGKQNCGKQHQHHVQANLKFLHYDYNDQFLRSVQIWPNFSLFFKLQFYNCLSSYSAEQICHFDITVTFVNFIGNWILNLENKPTFRRNKLNIWPRANCNSISKSCQTHFDKITAHMCTH